MINFYAETSTVISLMEERGTLEALENVVPVENVCGLSIKGDGETMYVVKFSADGEDDQVVCMHLIHPTRDESDVATQWFYSIIDPSSAVGEANEHFQA